MPAPMPITHLVPLSLVALQLAAFEPRPPMTSEDLPSAALANGTDTITLSLRALAQAESGSISVDATDVTIEELFQRIQNFGSLSLRIDWPALSRIGVAKDDRLDFHIKDVPPLAALKAIVSAMDADIDRPVIDASAGQIVVTSPNGLAGLRELAIYDIADILADPTLIDAIALAASPVAAEEDEKDEAEEEAEEADPTANPNTKPAAPAREPESTHTTVAAETPMHARAERLIEIISEHIDPEGWIDSGGSRGRITSEAGRLIVTATPMTHRQLRSLLATLREQAPTSATITCQIAAVETSALDELLGRSGTSANRQTTVDAVRALASFRIVAAPRVAAEMGSAATVAIKNTPSSADGGTTVQCRATPTFDRAHKRFGVGVTLELTHGTQSASLDSSVSGALSGGAHGFTDLLRLAGGPSATESWVVIVEAEANRRDDTG